MINVNKLLVGRNEGKCVFERPKSRGSKILEISKTGSMCGLESSAQDRVLGLAIVQG
jgi:hypothetical protein